MTEVSGVSHRRVALQTVAVNMLLPATALLTGPVLARALGVEDRGLVAAIATPVALVPLLLSLGTPEAAAYWAARRTHAAASLTVAVLGLSTLAGVLGTALVWVLAPVLLASQPQAVDLMRTAAVAVLVPTLVLEGVRGLRLGRGEFGRVNVERLVATGARLLLLLGLATLGLLDVRAAVGVQLGVAVLAGLAVLVGVRAVPRLLRALPGAVRGARAAGRDLLGFGSRLWAGQLANTLTLKLDLALMLPLAGARQAGLYTVAVAVGEILHIGGSALRSVTLTVFTQREDPALTARAHRTVLLLTGAAAAVGVVTAPVVVPLLFGADFRDAVLPTQVLLAAAVPATAASVLSTGLAALGRPGAAVAPQVVALVVSVAGLALVVPASGAVGAAVVSLVAYSALLAVSVVAYCRASGMSVWTVLVPGPADVRDLRRAGLARRSR